MDATTSLPLLVVVFGSAGVLAGRVSRWLLPRLRRGCSVHSGWCEAGAGLLWAVVGARLHQLPWWWLPIPLALCWLAVTLTVIDLAHRRLPDALTLPAYPVAAALLAVAACFGGARLASGAVLGAAVFLAVHVGVHLASRSSLGLGDVKLAGPLGAVLGAVGLPALATAAVLAAGVTAALGLALRRRTGVPHGPGLLLATCAVALFPGGLSPPGVT